MEKVNMLKEAIRGAFDRIGLEVTRKRVPPRPFIPYIESYDLKYRGAVDPCRFRFWLASTAGEQWYKEWFHAASNPTWELDEYAQMVKSGDRVLEIGCHHGFLTMMLAHLTGPSGFILALDANPENVVIAQAQMSLNGIGDHCKVLFAAGAERAGEIEFAWRTNSHAITDKKGASGETATYIAPTVTGDDLAKQYGPFDVLKVDVEGFEASVLRGCREILSRRPKLILELHPHFMESFGYRTSLADVFELIAASEYEGTLVVRPDFHKPIPFDPERVPANEVSNVHLRPIQR